MISLESVVVAAVVAAALFWAARKIRKRFSAASSGRPAGCGGCACASGCDGAVDGSAQNCGSKDGRG